MKIILPIATAALLAIAAITPSCKPDEKQCDTALQDSLNVRELRLKEREVALREREMAIMEREQQLGISGGSSFSGAAGSKTGAASTENGGRTTVKNTLKPGANDPKGVAYKKPVLDFPGQFPESSERALTEEDMEHKSAFGMKVMLNEVYARHGYIFPDPEMQKHFMNESWYKGTEKSQGKIRLTATETQNVAFIKKHQQDAKR